MRRILLALSAAGLAIALTGCFNPFSPLVSQERVASSPAPIPNSATNIVRLFEWCYRNRAAAEYREVFTDDYRFQFALGDSSGNLYREVPFRREDELAATTNLFVGDADHVPAKTITLDLAKTLFAVPDGRAGKNPRWHRQIRTTVDLKIEIDHGGGSTELNTISGNALFYLVRGDSAAIPPELQLKGFVSDSTRWWIERWEDETLPSGSNGGGVPNGAGSAGALRATRPSAAGSVLTRQISMGFLKAMFR